MHSQSRFIPESLSLFLDNARWLAALLVVVNHVNTRFFPKFSQTNVVDRTTADYVWAFLSGFSHHAVVVFFVLSGYLVGGRLLVSLRNGKGFNVTRYFIDRFARIYLVLIPVLGITYLLDRFGLENFGSPVYGIGVAESLSGYVFLGNVFSLQDFIVPPYGTNGPLYTLANEFWYYIIFPMLLSPVFAKGWARVFTFVAGATLCGSLVWLSPWHGVGFILWILGACVALLPASRIGSHPKVFLSIFLVYLVSVRLIVRGDEVSFLWRSFFDIGAALSCCSVIYALRFSSSPSSFFSLGGWSKVAADCSYSLYSVHLTIINLFSAYLDRFWGFGYKSGVGDIGQWFFLILMIAFIWFVAFCFGALTEARTLGVRLWFYRRFGVAE